MANAGMFEEVWGMNNKNRSRYYFCLAVIWFVMALVLISKGKYMLGVIWIMVAGVQLYTAISMRNR
jgi:hypothetical protein